MTAAAGIDALGAVDLAARYRARELSPVEVVAAARDRAEELADLGAFTATRWDAALAEAREHERAFAAGEHAGPLAGIPLAVKDLVDAAGLPAAYGSPLFAGHLPRSDARAVANARRAGAILAGKTATHEFAWGITSINPAVGTPRNPWDPDRVAGGSSGGSAVAVASGQVPLALGTDTAGSIRIPAAFCGVTGIKPTYGTIPVEGVFPLAPTLDTVGALARDAAGAQLLIDALAGDGPAAPAAATELPDTFRVGIPPAGAEGALPAAQRAALAATRDALRALGAEVVEVALPDPELAVAALRTIQAVEALTVHRGRGLYPARADGYSEETRARLAAAQRIGEREQLAARVERERLRARFATTFATVDFLHTACTGCPPPAIAALAEPGAGDRLRAEVLPHTVPQSLLGLPAVALPGGRDGDGLPVGTQLTGRSGADRATAALADAATAALGAESPVPTGGSPVGEPAQPPRRRNDGPVPLR